MSVSPAARPVLTTIRRAGDGLDFAKPGPKPEPIPDPDEDVAARDRRPPLPAGRGHFPPKLPSQAAPPEFPKPRERSFSKSVRVPESVLDQLEAICRARKIDFSALVLHYVVAGLRMPFAPEKSGG